MTTAQYRSFALSRDPETKSLTTVVDLVQSCGADQDDISLFLKGVVRVSSKLTSSHRDSNVLFSVEGGSISEPHAARSRSDGVAPSVSPGTDKPVPAKALAIPPDEPVITAETVDTIDPEAALASFRIAAGSIARLMGRQAARVVFAEIDPSIPANIIVVILIAAALVYLAQSYLVQP